MNQKKILYVRTDLGTTALIGGGSVAHTLGVLKGLITLGHAVICASSAMHQLLFELQKKQSRLSTFVPLYMPSIIKPLGFKVNCLLSNIIFYYKTKKLIKEHNINLIYQRYSMLNGVGIWLSKRFNIPIFLEFNGPEGWVDTHWSKGRTLKLTWLIEKIELYNLKYATKIVVVSQALKDQLIERDIDAAKIQVNPNGVDMQQFNPQRLTVERKKLRTTLGIQNKFVFGFSGSFSWWHGINILSYMIPQIIKKEPRAHFFLIGDGPLKEQLYGQLKHQNVLSSVTFTGMIKTEQMPNHLAACDAFLCPTQHNKDGTRFFGSPTKLFEYMAMAKPIIASDIEQLGQVLKADHDTPLGILVCPDDYDGFIRAALDLMQMNQEEIKTMAYNAQSKVKKSHTWVQHTERIMR